MVAGLNFYWLENFLDWTVVCMAKAYCTSYCTSYFTGKVSWCPSIHKNMKPFHLEQFAIYGT